MLGCLERAVNSNRNCGAYSFSFSQIIINGSSSPAFSRPYAPAKRTFLV
ncbi:MAG: hypothetical protein WCF28_01550 [Methanobacterium sp.]